MPDRNPSQHVPANASPDGPASTDMVALLKEQADGLRVELGQLRRTLEQTKSDLAAQRVEELREANEALVIAALHSESIAQAAMSSLAEIRAGNERKQHLRETNERLVIAALDADERRELAEGKQREQVKFIAMVAHELRNPLNPIRTAAELLKRARLDASTIGSVQLVIERQVVHMTQLIEDLLEQSRGSTGKFRLTLAQIEMQEVLATAIATCRPAMDVRHQQFHAELPSEPVHVLGDRVRLAQIFSNVLDNASKYTPEHGHISLAMTDDAESVFVSVVDDGIGLSQEALPHIFELFVQDERALRVHSAGLGIGLAVVHDLVTSHGGTVVAKSAGPGRGSEFVVKLPMHKVAAS